MNIHLAGAEAVLMNPKKHINIYKYDCFLVSFAHFIKSRRSIEDKVKKIFDNFSDKKILLDSGAFSLGTGTIKFSLSDYIDFLHKWGNKFFAYVTLDVTLLGNNITQERINDSIYQTEENLRILESEGLTPIPVYQRKWNRLDILEKYLEKYEYICIGGIATGIKESNKDFTIRFLDQVFEMNSKYKKKLHGLGQTQNFVLKEYPFYSVDSTCWLYGAIDFLIYRNIMDSYKLIETGKKEFKQYIINPILFDNYKNHEYPASVTRCDYNIDFYNRYQRILRELWKERGVSWSEYTLNGSSK